MAFRVELTARSRRDLARLYRRIRAEDSIQAGDWFNGLERAIGSLSDHPSRCPATSEDPRLRHLLYGAGRNTYRIIFLIEISRGVVSVLHIRHSAQEPLAEGRLR